MSQIDVHVRYFAALREALGAQEMLAVVTGTTVAALRDGLIARGGKHAELLARGRAVRCARNHVMCEETAVLAPGDELAFFPPVTGG